MHTCLISAATATDFEEPADACNREVRRRADAPPLGVLALAGVLEARRQTPSIVNLNYCYYDYLASGRSGVDNFAAWAADSVLSTQADIYGFSSLCSSYPTTIRIAELVKKARPDSVILLGGPQASVVDLRTLEAFPFVDYILRGEADESIIQFVDEFQGARRFGSVPGLSWRSPFGPVRNADAPVILDLDVLPLPAFHLTGELKGLKVAPLELGRGCPFACTFCSTNDFFRRKFRLRSPRRVLADMRLIASRWGIRAFELTHDMFTVDRRKVVEFCDCISQSGDDFAWSCSARTDCVDEELLRLMARAGCKGVFFGIETGSQRLQKLIDKDLDVDRAREIVSFAERCGIRTTVSLITGFPEETFDDVRATVDMYMYSLRHPGSDPQFHLLAPLAGTPIHQQFRTELTLEELCSGSSHQGRRQNELDRALIRTYPDIFPNFYLTPTPHLNRDFLLELREFLLMGSNRLRWLFVALHVTTSGILDVFCAWRKHRQVASDLKGWDLRTYYMLAESQAQFVDFVSDRENLLSPAVEGLARFYEAIAEQSITGSAGRNVAAWPGQGIPVRAPGVYAITLDWDIQGIIDSLKRGEAPARIDRRPRSFRTNPTSKEDARVVETTALIAAGLDACDGRNMAGDFVDRLAGMFEGPTQTRRLAAECLLETLRDQGLVDLSEAPLTQESPIPSSV